MKPNKAVIAGIGQTEFSKNSGRSELQLACEAIKLALAAHGRGDLARAEKARASVLRKYHEAISLPRHVRLARAVAQTRS